MRSEANVRTCGLPCILSPALDNGEPLNNRGYIANPPACGRLVILFPFERHKGPPSCHELCSQSAHLWATHDFVTHSQALGARDTVGVA